MGVRFHEIWFKAGDKELAAKAVEAWARDPGLVGPPGVWKRLSEGDFDGARVAEHAALCPEELSRFGEAVYLAMYDGPASELCGSFFYEHAAAGKVRRALVFVVGPDEIQRWQRVEGDAEPWEAAFLAKELKMDEQIRSWRDEFRWNDPPTPQPGEEDEAAARRRWSRLVRGERFPRLNEYALCRAVWDRVLQPRIAPPPERA